MDSSTSELVILLIGIVAALSSFHHYFAAEGEKRKSMLFVSLLAVSITTQVVTQWLQYHNAVLTRQQQDRRTSDALYAFNEKDERLLLKVADPRLSDSNAFIIGYWYFKRGYPEYLAHGNTEKAKRYLDLSRTYLNLAIHDKRFLPQSYYLLGTINRATQKENWSEAKEDFDKALDADSEYAAAYYGRAILRQESKDLQGALDDLEQATTFSVITCWDLRDPQEQNERWMLIKSMDRYHEIAERCGARFGLLPSAEPSPSAASDSKTVTGSQTSGSNGKAP